MSSIGLALKQTLGDKMDNVFGLGEALAAVKKKSKGRRIVTKKCVVVKGMPGIAVCTLGKVAAKRKARKARKARRGARRVRACPKGSVPVAARCVKRKKKPRSAAQKAATIRMQEALMWKQRRGGKVAGLGKASRRKRRSKR